MCPFNHVYVYSLVVLTIFTVLYDISLELFHVGKLKFHPNNNSSFLPPWSHDICYRKQGDVMGCNWMLG